MKIGIFSDLHLEFRNSVSDMMQLMDNLRRECIGVDLVVNAGDTHPDRKSRDIVRKIFHDHQYIEVLGNHDYYHGTLQRGTYTTHYAGSLKIVSGTLWTNFRDDCAVEYNAEQSISDFRLIKGITTDIAKNEFYKTKEYIELQKPDIVVTHFAPHPLSTHPRYAGDVLNPYFVNDLSDTIEVVKPKLWIHGHVHDPFDYIVDDTRVVCNPLAYPRERYSSINDYHVQIVEV